MTVRALILDFDGLIADTESPDFTSWQEVFQDHGARLELDVWKQAIGTTIGPGRFDPYDHLEEQIGHPVDREALTVTRRSRFANLVEATVILAGVEEYLADAKELGLGIGLASSSTHEWVDTHLARLGILDRFDVIRCRDDVAAPKPEPDLYLSALELLGAAASEAIALEDSPNGILAAKRAGIFCVAVPNALTRQLRLDKADLVLESLAEMPLVNLIQWIETSRGATA